MAPSKDKILVVDDVSLNREILRELLIKEGYAVFEAENGKVALEILKKEKIDLVVLDIIMPVMDGYEACGRIKADPLTEDIPVIMLTSKEIDEGLDKALAKKADWYFVKPHDNKRLIRQVKYLINKKRGIQPEIKDSKFKEENYL